MKLTIRAALLLFALSFPFAPAEASVSSRALAKVRAAKCTGSASCRACKNCRYCQHCAKDGGTCGVCARGASSRKSWKQAAASVHAGASQ